MALGRPRVIRTSIVHRRCLIEEQYYCHILMGHHTSRLLKYGRKKEITTCSNAISDFLEKTTELSARC